jgi:hypothetical protein
MSIWFTLPRNISPLTRLRYHTRTMALLASVPALAAPMAFKNHPDIKIPKMVYGTAWKKKRSANLVYQAIKAGFRGIDTAAQPRHYNEKGVAEGIERAITEGIVKREDLYVRLISSSPCYSSQLICLRFKQNSHLRVAKIQITYLTTSRIR